MQEAGFPYQPFEAKASTIISPYDKGNINRLHDNDQLVNTLRK